MDKIIVFCDIDGVLNSDYHTRINGGVFEQIEERKVKNLKKIVDCTNASVIIVSHANTMFGEEFNQYRLNLIRQYGVIPIDCLKTNSFLENKEYIVKKYIKEHQIERFVIIDDKLDNYYELVDHLVLIKGKHGLTNTHVKLAISKLV